LANFSRECSFTGILLPGCHGPADVTAHAGSTEKALNNTSISGDIKIR
jgi:hypothetical protein